MEEKEKDVLNIWLSSSFHQCFAALGQVCQCIKTGNGGNFLLPCSFVISSYVSFSCSRNDLMKSGENISKAFNFDFCADSFLFPRWNHSVQNLTLRQSPIKKSFPPLWHHSLYPSSHIWAVLDFISPLREHRFQELHQFQWLWCVTRNSLILGKLGLLTILGFGEYFAHLLI